MAKRHYANHSGVLATVGISNVFVSARLALCGFNGSIYNYFNVELIVLLVIDLLIIRERNES